MEDILEPSVCLLSQEGGGLMENAVAIRTDAQVVNYEDYAMTPDRIVKQVGLIQEVMKSVMHLGEHYGKIPGCGDKPTLLKPGAEKLCTTFRLAPSYVITEKIIPNGHREYQVVCTLTHIPTGAIFGQGVGSASTMESKYRYRKAERVCPMCGKEAIIKGKEEYGGGFICFAKKGGCGAKFKADDPAIKDQVVGKTEYEDPADYYNTILKMAKKRAHVDATLTCTAASDIFTQDVEDLPAQLLKKNEPPIIDVPVKDVSPPPPVSTDAEKPEYPEFYQEPLAVGTELRTKVDGLIAEAGIDAKLFKKWLHVGKHIQEKFGHPSLSTMPVDFAQKLIDNWKPTLKSFSLWVDKHNEAKA
jgi:hypothetical protein